MNNEQFPLQGIIGVVGSDVGEVNQAVEHGLSCVEVRADLLVDSGHTEYAVLEIISKIRARNLKSLFTMRRFDHGGKFSGTEKDRFDFCLRAFEAGADAVDVEWDSTSAVDLIGSNIPTILSHHDFHQTPGPDELERLTDAMLAKMPAALKIASTATSLADAVRMLRWVREQESGPRRIGFAMGACGACSRILTTVFGAPITYASFGESLAPGQLSISEMKSVYSREGTNSNTRLIGLLGDEEQTRQWAHQINSSSWAKRQNYFGIPITVDSQQELIDVAGFLKLELVFVSNETSPGFVNCSQQDIPEEGDFQIYEIGGDPTAGIGRNCTSEVKELLSAAG
jgi:3-dehydroquinate dehydratase-1